MSRTALVVMLVVAVGLAAAAYFLLQTPKGTAGSGRVLDFDPSEITAIIIPREGTRGDRIERLTRSADGSEWNLEIEGGGPGAGTEWTVAVPQVRGLLRLLSTLPVDPADGLPDLDPKAVHVVLARGGGDVAFAVSTSRVSGKSLLWRFDDIDSDWKAAGTYWVDAQLASALTQESVLAWRDRTLLRGIGPETSKVSLRGPGGTVAAQRVLGKWGLTEPVAAAASQDAIERLVASLAALRAEEFVDAPPDGALSNPGATATVTLTSRGADGGAIASTRTLEIGSAADLAGSRLYARVIEAGASGERQYVATLDAAALSKLTTDPVSYIDPRGATFPAADVGGVVLVGRTYTRTPRGWSGDGGAEPLSAEDASVLSAFLQVITEHAAGSILLESPPGVTEWRDLELRSLGGEPLAMMRVGIDGGDGQQPRAVVRDGGVWRVYAAPDDLAAARAALGLAER